MTDFDALPWETPEGGLPQPETTSLRPVRVHVDGTKRCPGCHVTKAVEEYNKNAAARDGLQPRCRDCQHAPDDVKGTYWTADQRIELASTGRKRCWDCGRHLPYDAFCRNRKRADGRHTECRECRAEQRRLQRLARESEDFTIGGAL